eukprot:3940313-Rhodomonas_salina.4
MSVPDTAERALCLETAGAGGTVGGAPGPCSCISNNDVDGDGRIVFGGPRGGAGRVAVTVSLNWTRECKLGPDAPSQRHLERA